MASKKPKPLTFREVQETCRTIVGDLDEDDERANALLVLINEFRSHRSDRLYIEDIADTLVLEVFRETRAFEKAACDFADSATVPLP